LFSLGGLFLGPAASSAIASVGRRYAAGLTGLFGPAAAFGGFGLALRATPPQRWASRPNLSTSPKKRAESGDIL